MKNRLSAVPAKAFFFLLFFLVLFCSQTTSAQWSAAFSTMQEYDSSPYRSPVDEPDIISSYNGGLEYGFGSFNLLYYGSYSLFNETKERNYYWHQLGIYNIGESSAFGLYGEQRINKTDFNFYDYISFTGYYRQKFDSLLLTPVINFTGSYRKYRIISDYNNIFLSAGINVNKSFQTKTAVIVNSSFNYKYYPVREDDSGLSSSQLYFNFRVAQSIFEGTGIAAYYFNRSLLGESLTLAGDYTYSFGDESDLYDDPYSRNENAFGMELTQILPEEIIAKAGFEISKKNYPSQGIYIDAETYETGTDRDDRQNAFYLKMNKTIAFDSTGLPSLNIGLSYSFINKNSNSYWYEYEGSLFSINLGLQL
ncbi:MAG: hypothetical protein PVH88_21965 [Ignavibacteria bacterium]|jgi:hypothetical protein